MGHFLANRGWWFEFLRWVLRWPAFREIFLMILGIGVGIHLHFAWALELPLQLLVFAGIYLVSWIVHAISDRGGFAEMSFWILGALLWGITTSWVFVTAYQVFRFLIQ